jgi:hypothetical protein
MVAAVSNSSVGPASIISSAAAFSTFPASRFAARNASGSAAPDAETPCCAQPKRPRSWTVVSSPGLTTRIIRPPRKAGLKPGAG